VFDAWTKAEHVCQWFGPHMFTNEDCVVDPRPGGTFRLGRRGPDGTVGQLSGTFHDVIRPERIEMTIAWVNEKGEPIISADYTIVLTEVREGTKLSMTARVTKAEDWAAQALAGMQEGWSQSLDRLASLVATDASERDMVITRVFDAPRELVWNAWTDPKQVTQWWGPDGFMSTIEQMDVRPGGVWKHMMVGPDGTRYPNKSVFREVVKPERLVYTHGGGKEDGSASASFESTVRFEEETDGRTRVTMRAHFGSRDARAFVMKTFRAYEGGHQTLNKLAMYLHHS
jgi:uncharacterized protein YndB with AHSA1/START domain